MLPLNLSCVQLIHLIQSSQVFEKFIDALVRGFNNL